MEVLLEAKNLCKYYHAGKENEVKAIDHISLQIMKGDFVCIMGPSGSGKSTLLNVLSTLDNQTSGSIQIKGNEVQYMNEMELVDFRSRFLGFVFQDYQLMEELNLQDNILLPLAINEVEETFAIQRCQEVAKELKIDNILQHFPRECSGGQCQRAAIARALIRNPELIVMDEPTGNLDSDHSHEIMSIIHTMNKEHGHTILMVTHDPLIASYANQVIFIRDGKIDALLQKETLKQIEFYHLVVKENSKESLHRLFHTDQA